MVYRFSWIAGIAAIGLAFWELSFLLRDSVTGTPWQLAIVIATALAATITWTLLSYRAHAIVVAAGNVVGFVITGGLLIAPETLWTILPTSATWTAVQFELGRALEVIRYGVEPVRPVPGLILLLAALFWILGFLLVAGLLNERPFVAVITPLVIALQFVIIDRPPRGILHVGIFLGVVALSLLAIRADERDHGSGRLQRVNATRPPSKRPTPAITALVGATIVLAIGAVALIGESVPNDGLVTWRTPSGYTDDYSGSVSYNPYTDIQASLISQTNLPLFVATVEGMPADELRFRTVTLDVYRDGRWQTDRVRAFPTDEETWIDDSQVYRGETVEVTASIRIENLSQPWMPAPTTSNFVATADEGDFKTIRVRRLDGTLYLPGDFTYKGMEYTVRAEVARYNGATLAALARTEDGTLSPLFQAAEEANEFLPQSDVELEPLELTNEDFWTEYPDDLGAKVIAIAEGLTVNLETNYEKAIALENYFRYGNERYGEFTYNDSVPAEYTTSSVEDWLTDESNPYVRNGYCEQYATSMALMARALGVPSRVVLGFAPGKEMLNDNTVLIQDKNAHSWVEIWIPRFGWMMFDPTPRPGYSAPTINDTLTEYLDFSPVAFIDEIPDQDAIDTEGGEVGPDQGRFDRPEPVDRIRASGGGESGTESSGLSLPSWLPPLGAAILILVLVTGLAPLTKWLRARRRRKRLAHGDVTAAWQDIADRLADLGEPLDPASTPLEAASRVDEAFVPLARTYGDALYGERETSTALIERATEAHLQAYEHMTTRYTPLERTVAMYRPTRMITRWQLFVGKRNGNKQRDPGTRD
jgi:transglutaminase-like putative cysteine protease